MRFNWVHVRVAAIDADEMREAVEGAWAMCVPKLVAAEYAALQGYQVESEALRRASALAVHRMSSLETTIARICGASSKRTMGLEPTTPGLGSQCSTN